MDQGHFLKPASYGPLVSVPSRISLACCLWVLRRSLFITIPNFPPSLRSFLSLFPPLFLSSISSSFFSPLPPFFFCKVDVLSNKPKYRLSPINNQPVLSMFYTSLALHTEGITYLVLQYKFNFRQTSIVILAHSPRYCIQRSPPTLMMLQYETFCVFS